MLSYKRYTEGEFLELNKNYETISEFGEIFIKTQEARFYEWINNKAILQGNSAVLWNGNRF